MPVRVMTYNILKGGIGRQTELQVVIQAANPDVVVLQEVTDLDLLRKRKSIINRTDRFT